MPPAQSSEAQEILHRNITALNDRDMQAYLANQHPDVRLTVPGGATLHGREQVRANTQALWDAFPDGRLEFGARVLADDSAAVEVIFTGTHTGPLPTPSGDVPSTGKAVRTTSVSLLTFADGLVRSERVFGDQLDLLTQLGLMPGSSPGA